MAITINYEEPANTFTIWDLREEDGFEPFEKRRSYTGFLIKRK